ncbi:Myeloid-associated differentiation marker Myeloid up-regulated protein [Channa argus]|uniref:Myeloid-associated differentiation marker Myeloid up-regulated protein n=1 Tax=Channa argus TaxID=215402 RepID=A0A6G1PAX8_CHAAH|nr:Myeloid-associated differentiation marker Myeloid up-regulated protein [Channa argus]
MPVIVLEARDFTSPLFLVRTLEVLTSCTTFSIVASLEPSELHKNVSIHNHTNTFQLFSMFTWCFFFTITLLIHILSVIQFHSLIPISWKNLTMTVAVLGALMCFSASLVFPWIVMDHQRLSPSSVTAAVAAFLTFIAYSSESYILQTQTHEQRGYMGSVPGLLKIVQLWGGCQVIPLVMEVVCGSSSKVHCWQQSVSCVSYGICILMSLVILVVILGDFAGRCLLPFDRFLAVFSLTGVLFYVVVTVICFTKILQMQDPSVKTENVNLVIMETVLAIITLLAYTVDLAFSIKLLCDRT